MLTVNNFLKTDSFWLNENDKRKRAEENEINSQLFKMYLNQTSFITSLK